MLRQKAVASEIMIRLLDCPLKREFTGSSHVLLVITNRTTVGILKRKLQGVTRIPVNRMMLLFCGEVLSDDKAVVPHDVMESSELNPEEDEIKFTPRIHLKTVERQEDEEEDHISVPEEETESGDDHQFSDQENINNKKRRKKVGAKNPYESFSLEETLKSIDCEKFTEALENAGYGNEGSFAHLNTHDLDERGLRVPKGPASRILKLSESIREKLGEIDRKVTTAAKEVENEMKLEERIKPIALEGDQSGNQFIKKADLRRSWQRARIQMALEARRKKQEEEEPARDQRVSKELEERIERIKRRCREEQHASDPDFDNTSGLLYSSARHRIHIKGMNSPSKMKLNRPEALRLTTLAMNCPGGRKNNKSESIQVVEFVGQHNSEKSLISQKTISGCCVRHRETVAAIREKFIEQRRLINGLELLVQLERLGTFPQGHVRTSTLRIMMKRKLEQFFGNPPRAADPALPESCIFAAQLSLEEQKRVLFWRERKELLGENIGSLLPVQFYHPLKFIDAFLDALEQLDRQRLDGSAFSGRLIEAS